MSKIETKRIIRVAVPVPLRGGFDFILPDSMDVTEIGVRVLVPFGRRKLVGVVMELDTVPQVDASRLKSVLEVLDNEALFSEGLYQTILWLAEYYHAPIGEVFDAALPVALRQGKSVAPAPEISWRLTTLGKTAEIDELNRAPLQQALVQQFREKQEMRSEDFSEQSSGWRQAISSLLKKGWLEQQHTISQPVAETQNIERVNLTAQQEQAVAELNNLDSYHCSLLHGVTGSGKTEVYFEAMDTVLAKGKQVLLLVPEIGLTPQLIQRVKQRFTVPVVLMHSGLNDTQRHHAWWHARNGSAQIMIGTRSAVFAPFKDLGLIVVDEEHDNSFKQQDGVRYHARDVANYRAKKQNVPIVFGSATPSIETLAHAKAGRYQYVRLTERAAGAVLPQVLLLDLRGLPNNDGLSPPMIEAIEQCIQQKQQAILYLNRRGYAPVQYCSSCGWRGKCQRCDAHLTHHKAINKVRCHHCGYENIAPQQCPECGHPQLADVGEGTQRLEQALAERFPDANIVRIDRDSTRRKGELEAVLEKVRQGEGDILLGTQLLTKGHDFPNVAMVGIVNADQGLYSNDFRATEVLFQQILQVSGRAGRRQQQGKVYIQTHFPEHPCFQWLKQHDFDAFADDLLSERQAALYPPFGYFALIRAEATERSNALDFLQWASGRIPNIEHVSVMDAVPSPMERRAGRYRAQLLISSTDRAALHYSLKQWLNNISDQPQTRRIRWSLDIDPIDMY